MPESEILSLSREELQGLFRSGEARLVEPQGRKEPLRGEDADYHEAQRILGEKSLGPDALQTFEEQLRKVGVDVQFIYDTDNLPYTRKDLELATKRGGEILILRPKAMKIGKGRKAKEVPITIMNFRELLRKDPRGATTFYSFNPSANDWYKKEKFATEEAVRPGWALIGVDVPEASLEKNWSEQEDVLKNIGNVLTSEGALKAKLSRRNAAEAVFDTMLYYVVNGERLLPDVVDWTSSQSSDGRRVYVGYFREEGLRVVNAHPDYSYSGIGVVTQR